MDTDATTNTIVKIAMGMDGVFTVQPIERAHAFAGVAAGVGHLLAGLEGNRVDGSQPEAVTAVNSDFTCKARIYLRALKTYPAASAEWLEVFQAFRQLFDRWVAGPVWRPKTPASYAASELERLRLNPHLVLKTAIA